MRYFVICIVINLVYFTVVFGQDKSSGTTVNAIVSTTPKLIEPTSPPVASSTLKSSNTITELHVKSIEKPPKLICPGNSIPRPLFSLPCTSTKDCAFLGRGLLCCTNRCIKGIPPPKPEPIHSPTWFGLVQRVCPVEPIPELWDIQECRTDMECAPRICCPEKFNNGTILGFCRIPEPKLERLPVANRFFEPLRAVVSYMQCTPPPPPFLDLFPKPCRTPLDCFPNLCCQERGKRYCRPPKRSLLALVAGVTQRLVPDDTAKKLIERLN